MDFSRYQDEARSTDRIPSEGGVQVHLLGLAGEAGSVTAEYKKRLRDGEAHLRWREHMQEELGDLLWYLAAVASDLGLELEAIAAANLIKVQSRWGATTPELGPLDACWPPNERMPTQGSMTFVSTHTDAGRPGVEIWWEGHQLGNELSDASRIDDGYRFHDVFHLSYAALLGWSPIIRSFLGRQRRSNPAVDENEDGGRAKVVEEGISALVFAYATQHDLLDGVKQIDQRLLTTIAMITENTEVEVRRAAAWERAILTGFEMFRLLKEHDGGVVTFDGEAGTMTFSPPNDS